MAVFRTQIFSCIPNFRQLFVCFQFNFHFDSGIWNQEAKVLKDQSNTDWILSTSKAMEHAQLLDKMVIFSKLISNTGFICLLHSIIEASTWLVSTCGPRVPQSNEHYTGSWSPTKSCWWSTGQSRSFANHRANESTDNKRNGSSCWSIRPNVSYGSRDSRVSLTLIINKQIPPLWLVDVFNCFGCLALVVWF